MKLSTHLCPVLKLRMGGASPLLPRMIFVACTPATLLTVRDEGGGCTNSGSQATKFCIVVANIFSIIIAIFPLNTKMGITACTRQKVPGNGEIHGSPRTVCF